MLGDDLLKLVLKALEASVQATARSSALEALLIEKGVVTKAELDSRTEQETAKTKKLAQSLESDSGEA